MRGIFALSLLLVGCGAAADASDSAAAPGAAGDGAEPGDPASQGAGAGNGAHDGGQGGATGDASDGGGSTSGDGGTGMGAAPPMPHQSFLIGYDQGWFGKSYATDLTTGFDRNYAQKILDDVNKAGGHVVRLWLFEGLQGITLASFAPQSQGVSSALLANLEMLLDDARARGIWVYVTGLNANDMPKTASTQRDYYWNLLNDKYGEGDAFDTNVLGPMLAVLNKHQDVVYGFDLVNEIEAARQNLYWTDTTNDARAFIQRTAAFVHKQSPWLKVTSSAGWTGSQYVLAGGFFSGLGLDFYDLHVYADSGTYDGMTAVCTRAKQDGVPVILGEFGQQTQSEDDNLQASATQTFLSNAKSACFTGALAWRFDAAEPWYNFERADGSFRPAVGVMQTFGAMP